MVDMHSLMLWHAAIKPGRDSYQLSGLLYCVSGKSGEGISELFSIFSKTAKILLATRTADWPLIQGA